MQPSPWHPPVELSEQEEQIVKKIRKAKLFIFLRKHRHELFDEAFQQELASLYRKVERGHSAANRQEPGIPGSEALSGEPLEAVLVAHTGWTSLMGSARPAAWDRLGLCDGEAGWLAALWDHPAGARLRPTV